MEIIKIIGVGFITAISSVLLKTTKPELSFAVTVTGVIIILLFIVDSMQKTFALFVLLGEKTGLKNELIKILLKIVGIGYLTEFGAGILTDFGSSAVADKIILAGKITIVLLSLPIIQSVLTLIGGFLNLL